MSLFQTKFTKKYWLIPACIAGIINTSASYADNQLVEGKNFTETLKPLSTLKNKGPSGLYLANPTTPLTLKNADNDTLKTTEFDQSRYGILLPKGSYNLTNPINLGFYTAISGVGTDETTVSVNQNIQVTNASQNPSGYCKHGKGNQEYPNCYKLNDFPSSLAENPAYQPGGLDNFWRSLSWLTIKSTTSTLFAISQAAPLRHVTFEDTLLMCDWHNTGGPCGMTSGGFMRGIKAKDINMGSQQQFYLKNVTGSIEGSVWNYVINGSSQQPALNSAADNTNGITHYIDMPIFDWKKDWEKYQAVLFTPVTHALPDKPRLIENNANWFVKVRGDRQEIKNYLLITPADNSPITQLTPSTIDTINQDLKTTKNGLVIEPGIYKMPENKTLTIPSNKTILGLGMTTLVCSQNSCIKTGNHNVNVSGILFEASDITQSNTNLLEVGTKKEDADKSPTTPENGNILQDDFCRIIDLQNETTHDKKTTQANSCITINSAAPYTQGEDLWLWRGDHNAQSNDKQPFVDANHAIAPHGLVVNAANVTIDDLAVEHFLGEQTQWSGKNGTINFYQSELPYIVSKDAILSASLSIGPNATNFTGNGIGIYSFLATQQKIAPAAIRIQQDKNTSTATFKNVFTRFLTGIPGSGFKTIIQYNDAACPTIKTGQSIIGFPLDVNTIKNLLKGSKYSNYTSYFGEQSYSGVGYKEIKQGGC